MTLTDRQCGILAAFDMYNSKGRKRFIADASVSPVEIGALVTVGLLSRNRAGAIKVSNAGNARIDSWGISRIGGCQGLVLDHEYCIPGGMDARHVDVDGGNS